MPPRAEPDPAGLPDLLTLTQALAVGLTPDQVRQRVRSGRWLRVSTGIYLRGSTAEQDPYEDARLLHVARATAAAMTHEDSVICLHSAAAVHGLPTVSRPPDVVHLISDAGRSGIRAGVSVHRLPLAMDEVITSDVPVTTPLRTWLDVTRFGSLPDSLAIGDAAVRRGLTTVLEIQQRVDGLDGRGCRMARLAATLVDGRRESPLESWSAVCFHRWQLPAPQPQVVIRDGDGRFVARVDFLWEDAKVIGEADGVLKYDDRQALVDEKRREDRLRELGFRVVRWGWADLNAKEELRWRLTTALRPRRFIRTG